MQLELVPAPITLAAEFSKVLDVPHSLPLPPRVVVQFYHHPEEIYVGIANLKSHYHPVLSSQRVRQPNIVQSKENYSYKAICHSYLLAPRTASWRLQTCQPTCNSSPRTELRKLRLFWRPSSLSQNTCRSPRIRSK